MRFATLMRRSCLAGQRKAHNLVESSISVEVVDRAASKSPKQVVLIRAVILLELELQGDHKPAVTWRQQVKLALLHLRAQVERERAGEGESCDQVKVLCPADKVSAIEPQNLGGHINADRDTVA